MPYRLREDITSLRPLLFVEPIYDADAYDECFAALRSYYVEDLLVAMEDPNEEDDEIKGEEQEGEATELKGEKGDIVEKKEGTRK